MVNKNFYFDNAATTFPKPEIVYSQMDRLYREMGVNVGRGQYQLASKASEHVDYLRAQLKQLFKAPSSTVILTPSATISLNYTIQGLNWDKIKNVYITPFEHNAVLRVLNYQKQKYNFNIQLLSVDENTLEYKLDEIKRNFTINTPDIVIMSHVSNVCGVITPIREISFLAKKYNSLTIVDSAQSAGLIDISLHEDYIDFLIFAGHKTLYGPLGIGGIVTNSPTLLHPIIFGGTGVDSRNEFMPNSYPEKLEPASLNIQAVYGLSAALDWINETSITKLKEKEEQSKLQLYEILNNYDFIKIIDNKISKNKICLVSCIFDGYSVDEAGLILGNNGIAIRTGLHCSPLSHKFLKTFPQGTIRFSSSYFTNAEDFDGLVNALENFD